MDEDLTEEDRLLEQAKTEILKRLIKVTSGGQSAVATLNLAEAFVILDRRQLSGRINVPPKD